ncbi:GNAT family N-acetyltransferase [Aestuariispira insulae]|uniref:Ribosomal-protein-alanine N-acetyltransferase n=1 Tax=Aestuariispira insulae TaxID=1461337 RepID=A0A3D9HHA6_9PROT|nr:GNAT family protein [Aestuariispira insulae]RED48641.1 ribosomal-protein-alanine N-acetyltransferase [Aestuariispira insulae]
MLGLLFGSRNNTRLTGPTVHIRPPKSRDYAAWSALREESRDFLKPWEPTWASDALSKRGFKRRLERFNREWEDGTGSPFFIIRNADSQLVGGITVSNIRRGIVQTANIGYWTGLPHIRKGYMAEALQLTLDYCFRIQGLHRVEAACLLRNSASRSLLESNGFTEEGLARQYLCIDGQWQDHVTYAILRTDPRPMPAVKEP